MTNEKMKTNTLSMCGEGSIYTPRESSRRMGLVPPPYIGNFMPLTPDLSYIGLDEFVNKLVAEIYKDKSSEEEPKAVGSSFWQWELSNQQWECLVHFTPNNPPLNLMRQDEIDDDAGKKSIEVPRKENEVQNSAKEGDKNDQENDLRDQEEALRKQFEQESKRLFGRERTQRNEFESMFRQDKDANGNRIFTHVSAAGSTYVNLGGSIPVNAATLPNDGLSTDPFMPDLEDTVDLQDTRIFSGAYDDEVEGAKADFNNL
nr:hypothetical protein [Tanacetum cinerariifolium]